jgi:hypothetical protein
MYLFSLGALFRFIAKVLIIADRYFSDFVKRVKAFQLLVSDRNQL